MDPREPTIDEREVLEFVDRTGKETAPLGPPGMWHGFGEGLGDATMQGFARTGRAAGMLLAAPVVMAERNANAARRLRGEPESHGVTDWYFENVVEDIGTDAVDYWKPQAAHVGAAGQTLNGLASALVPLAAGGAVPLIGTVAVDTPTELLDQGAPLGAALGVGAVQTAAVAAGVRIPAAWGSTLLSRLATGAGSNLVIGEASRELSARVLDHAGEQALAEQYGGDASAAFIDVGMGLAFGALAHAQAPRRITPNEQAALLTANNAHHFREGTAPGRLADSASEAAHVTAMETAVRQLLDGENVDIAAVIPDAGVGFVPRPRPLAEVGQVIDDRIAELERRATDGRLPEAEVAALVKEEAELRELLREQEALDKSGVMPSNPAARLSPDEVNFTTQRRAEIVASLERNRAARSFGNELSRLQRKLDRIDSDAGLRELADVLSPSARRQHASPGFDRAVARVLGDEGGFVNDPTDRGGETNFGISKRANPDVDVANLTREDAVALYRERYWEPIGGDRLPDDLQGVAFDAAVNQGVGWTRRALDEAGGDRGKFIAMREARYREIVANDPSQAKFLRGWLNRLGRYKETNPAGEALRERLVSDPEQLARDYAALEDSKGGTVLNTDTARELAPEYLADRTRSADVHEAASDTVKTIYEAKLAQPTPDGFDPVVMFTAGGTGAGKTTAVKAAGDAFGRPEITYDTNMNTLSSAVDKIEQALAADRDVSIVYIYRDPVEALTGGAIPRAERQAEKFGSGRTVPLDEHARTHEGVRPTIAALMERYAGNDRVNFGFIDNSRGKDNSARVESLEELPAWADNNLRERLQDSLEAARSKGLDEALYRGFNGRGRKSSVLGEAGLQDPRRVLGRPDAGDGGRPEPGDRGQVKPPAGESSDALAAAADQAILDTPDLLVVDDNGVARPAAEVMAEVQAAAADAAVQAQAVATAVECALRSGT